MNILKYIVVGVGGMMVGWNGFSMVICMFLRVCAQNVLDVRDTSFVESISSILMYKIAICWAVW